MQPTTMMSTGRDLDALTCPSVDALNQATRHPQSLPADPRVEVRDGPTPAASQVPRCCIRVDASASPDTGKRASPPTGYVRERSRRPLTIMDPTRREPAPRGGDDAHSV